MTIESDPMSVTASVPRNLQRVPDVRLQGADGGIVSPVDFTGHELIVLFPPTDDSLAAQELRDYRCRLADFDKMDAWLLAVCDWPTPVSDLAVVHDSDGSA